MFVRKKKDTSGGVKTTTTYATRVDNNNLAAVRSGELFDDAFLLEKHGTAFARECEGSLAEPRSRYTSG